MGRHKKNIINLKKKSLQVKKSILSVQSKKLNKNRVRESVALNSFSNQVASNNNLEYLDLHLINKSPVVEKVQDDLIQNIRNKIRINDDPVANTYLKKILQRISLKYNWSRESLSDLLKELKIFFPLLPSDYRSLLHTPRSTEIRKVGDGEYMNIGILVNIQRIITENYVKSSISIDIFVDGVAFYSDALKKSFWVILGRLDKAIFPIGVYNGFRQPSDFNELLLDCVNEAKMLETNGVQYKNTTLKFNIKNFCLDSPAKASVCFITHPTGYCSCSYCFIKGWHDGSRIIFDESDCQKRTDEDFRLRLDMNHHKRNSLIESELNVDDDL